MSDRRSNNVDASTALAVALLFVVHTFLMALSSATHAAPARLDAFGNPLCLTLTGAPRGEGGPAGHRSSGDCCTFACHAAAGCAKLLSRIPALALPQASVAASDALPASPLPRGVERSSIRARGPPGLV